MSVTPEQAAEQIKSIVFPESESQDQPIQEPVATPPMETQDTSEEAESAPIEEGEVELESEPELQESSNWTFSELAEALDRSPDDLLETLSLDIDGEPMTLAELRKSRMREADYTRKTQEVAEKRKAYEAKQTELESQYAQRLQEAGALIQNDEQRLIQEFNAVNWKDLEETDREEYIIKRQKFEDRARELTHRKNSIVQNAERFQKEQKQRWTEGLKTHIQNEYSELRSKFPEYIDEKKGPAIQDGVRKYMLSLGYKADEIDGKANGDEIIAPGLTDHRMIIMAHKARLYDELQAKKPALENKVKSVPKVLKPGARRSKSDVMAKAQQEKLSRLKKTGKVQDAQAIIRSMILEE